MQNQPQGRRLTLLVSLLLCLLVPCILFWSRFSGSIYDTAWTFFHSAEADSKGSSLKASSPLPVYQTPDDFRGISQAVFSPDGRTVAFASGRRIAFWEPTRGSLPEVIGFHDREVWSVAFSPDGSILISGSEDGVIKCWSVSSRSGRSVAEQLGPIKKLIFSPLGKSFISIARNGPAILWDAATHQALRELSRDGLASDVAFIGENQVVLAESQITLLDLISGKRVVLEDSATPTCVAASETGQVVGAGFSDGSVRFWGVADGKRFATTAHDDVVYGIAISRDGKWAASASMKARLEEVVLFNLTSRVRSLHLYGDYGSAMSVCISADSKFVAVGGSGVRIFAPDW